MAGLEGLLELDRREARLREGREGRQLVAAAPGRAQRHLQRRPANHHITQVTRRGDLQNRAKLLQKLLDQLVPLQDLQS